MSNLSLEQLHDATGVLSRELSARSDLKRISEVIVTPSFIEIFRVFNADNADNKAFSRKNPDTNQLRKIHGARAVATYRAGNKLVHSPAIVLPDGNLGVLNNNSDTKNQPTELSELSDFQQLLLASVYSREREGTGIDHTSGIAEVGHATLVAVSRNPEAIHTTTHQLAESGRLGTEISRQTAIIDSSRQRPTDTIILNSARVTLTFVPEHQSPLPVVDPFEASAGLALAATKTQDPRFDVGRNADAMAYQLGGNH